MKSDMAGNLVFWRSSKILLFAVMRRSHAVRIYSGQAQQIYFAVVGDLAIRLHEERCIHRDQQEQIRKK